MKKASILILLATLITLPASVRAQSPEAGEPADTTRNSIGLVDGEGRRILTLSGSEENSDSDFSLSVLGLKIDFKGAEKPKPSVWVDVLSQFKMGGARMTAPGYSMYPDGTPEFLDYEAGRSWAFEWVIIDVGIALNEKRTLNFHTGVNMKLVEYRFSQRYTLDKQNGMVIPEYIPDEMSRFRKSKFNYTTLTIPATLQYNFGNDFFIRGGVYMDFVVKQTTVIKKPKITQKRDYGLNIAQAGATMQFGHDWLFLYFDYGIVPLFKHNKGPRTNPYSFGVGINFVTW